MSRAKRHYFDRIGKYKNPDVSQVSIRDIKIIIFNDIFHVLDLVIELFRCWWARGLLLAEGKCI